MRRPAAAIEPRSRMPSSKAALPGPKGMSGARDRRRKIGERIAAKEARRAAAANRGRACNVPAVRYLPFHITITPKTLCAAAFCWPCPPCCPPAPPLRGRRRWLRRQRICSSRWRRSLPASGGRPASCCACPLAPPATLLARSNRAARWSCSCRRMRSSCCVCIVAATPAMGNPLCRRAHRTVHPAGFAHPHRGGACRAARGASGRSHHPFRHRRA